MQYTTSALNVAVQYTEWPQPCAELRILKPIVLKGLLDYVGLCSLIMQSYAKVLHFKVTEVHGFRLE